MSEPLAGSKVAAGRLVGWKAIAQHFGKSVRSVQRWELTLGLPVHRLPEDEGAIVYADPDEIDQWRRGLDTEPVSEPDDAPDGTPETVPEPTGLWRSRLWMAVAGAAIALFVAGGAIGWQMNRPVPVATDFKLAGQALLAVSATGSLVWSHQFGTDVTALTDSRRLIRTADLDGDDEVEAIVPVRFGKDGSDATTTDAVYAFSRTGVLKWSVRPETVLSIGSHTHSGPWELVDIVVPKSAAPRRTWLAFGLAAGASTEAHWTSGPGFILEVRPGGESDLVYVQAGPIAAVGNWVTPAGSFLAVSGRSDEHNQASLVLLRDDDPPSTFASGDSASPFHCPACPKDSVRRVLLFPSLELGRMRSVSPLLSTAYEFVPQLQMQYRQGNQNSAIIAINPDFSIDSFRFSDGHWASHRRDEREGRLDHSRQACPDLLEPMTVREWTPASGWREWAVRPSAEPNPGTVKGALRTD